MTTEYIVFLVVFIIVLSVFAYINTKEGMGFAASSFLKIFVPMLLSGIIVKIAHLIAKEPLISYIVGGIGTVIFFIVLQNVILTPEKKRKPGLLSFFFGFLIGIAQGWLVIGFLTSYVDFFKLIQVHSIIPASFFTAIVTPLKWVLFLDFIKF